jgi:hypothetical protein
VAARNPDADGSTAAWRVGVVGTKVSSASRRNGESRYPKQFCPILAATPEAHGERIFVSHQDTAGLPHAPRD